MSDPAPFDFEAPLTPFDKGVPGGIGEVPLDQVAQQGWSLLEEDLPMPAAVIKQAALHHNSRWMKGYLAMTGSLLAPHGKTTMSPALFGLQLADGAWGIALSTPHQMHVARRFGFRRILLANQLVGRAAIEWVVEELNSDPQFEFYCLVDSTENLDQLARAARRGGLKRPLRVLVELGFLDGRTGCRTVESALVVARHAASLGDVIALYGVEGFEGIIRAPTEAETIMRVEDFLSQMVALADACARENLFADGLVLFSAGGSAFFDLVSRRLGTIALRQEHAVVLRSGCYLTHDAVMYTYLFAQLKHRAPALAEHLGELQPALEVWAYVQSMPEPGRAILALGKRDISYDHMPVPIAWFRPGGLAQEPQPAGDGYRVVAMHDQHCVMTAPADSPWRVGDLVGLGISHPCLTFDKWRVLHLVDDAYRVTGSIRTYF